MDAAGVHAKLLLQGRRLSACVPCVPSARNGSLNYEGEPEPLSVGPGQAGPPFLRALMN